jgi:hypothetical protein
MASDSASTPVADSTAADQRGLRGFLNKGGVWRFIAFMIVYLVIYVGVGRITLLFARDLAEQPVLSSVSTVFIQLTLGLLVGAAILIATITYMGWTKQLFARQRIYRSWWMWLGPIVVAIPIVLRVLGIDWGRNAVPVVLMVLATGLLIGFVEELMYRGIGVKMLRDGGHGEFAVAALTSLLFACLTASTSSAASRSPLSARPWSTPSPSGC